jgi:hypothetical protein
MITLSRALKYKNRVIEKMRKIETDIQANNSILEGAERNYDPNVLLEERLILESHLVDLKLKIDAANAPIKESIIRMQELKSRLTFLQSIGTAHGKQQSHRNLYGDEGEVVYQAVIRKNRVDKMISDINRLIDGLQEEIDRHNNTQTIDIVLFEF